MTGRLRHAESKDAVGIANLDHYDVPNSIVSFKGDGSPQDMAGRSAVISIDYHERAAHRHRVATGVSVIARAIAEVRAPGSAGALHPCRHRPYFNSKRSVSHAHIWIDVAYWQPIP
jgi:hypothetical protein